MSERGKTVKKKKRWGKVYEYTPIIRSSVLTDEDQLKEIQSELKKSGVFTPQSLATKFNIKVSLAKRILQDHANNSKLDLIFSTHKNQIYKK